jgi:hypothetical protein
MHAKEHALLTTEQVSTVTGVGPSLLYQFLLAGCLEPVVKGSKGRSLSRKFSVWQTVSLAYGAACLDAGCCRHYAFEAVRWLVGQYPQFCGRVARGETLVALTPDGRGRLVKPEPPPDATRKERLALANLDLGVVWRTTLARIERMAVNQARVEKARASRARKR